MIRPIDLLKQEQDKLIRARDKSIKSFEAGEINKMLYDTHMENLTPMIEEYKHIILVIERYA